MQGWYKLFSDRNPMATDQYSASSSFKSSFDIVSVPGWLYVPAEIRRFFSGQGDSCAAI